jgi:hypothetical protein
MIENLNVHREQLAQKNLDRERRIEQIMQNIKGLLSARK